VLEFHLSRIVKETLIGAPAQTLKICWEEDEIPVAIRGVRCQIAALELMAKLAPMYRCYFTQNGHVEERYNLDVLTLDAAIATGRKILADHLDVDQCDGLEIWLDQAMLYKFSG
jgi:hypothetical protein